MLGVATIAIGAASCDSTAKQEKEKQEKIQKRQEKAEAIERRIITPEDFFNFASRTSDTSSWSDIDDVIQCMNTDKFINLIENYSEFLLHSSKTEVSKAKVYAMLLSALPLYIPENKDYYGKMQVDKLEDSPYFRLSYMAIGWSLGDDGFSNVQREYVRAIKDNGKLYKGQIISLENVSEYTLSSEQLNTNRTDRDADYGQDETIAVEEPREESRTLNGVWSFQRIDPTTYDVWEYSLVFRGHQFKFKTENSGGRASEGQWLDYKISGNDIYIDGERLYTIESDGSIQRIQDGQIFSK